MTDNLRYMTDAPSANKPKALDKLKQAWDENPLAVMAVVGAALAGAGKFIDAVTGYQSRKAYAKQVNDRSKREKR